MAKSTVKAVKGDIVIHCGKNWTVKDRDYDWYCGQSYYTLQRGKGRNIETKFVRSDKFSVK